LLTGYSTLQGAEDGFTKSTKTLDRLDSCDGVSRGSDDFSLNKYMKHLFMEEEVLKGFGVTEKGSSSPDKRGNLCGREEGVT
jgi:hypothetical protein